MLEYAMREEQVVRGRFRQGVEAGKDRVTRVR